MFYQLVNTRVRLCTYIQCKVAAYSHLHLAEGAEGAEGPGRQGRIEKTEESAYILQVYVYILDI